MILSAFLNRTRSLTVKYPINKTNTIYRNYPASVLNVSPMTFKRKTAVNKSYENLLFSLKYTFLIDRQAKMTSAPLKMTMNRDRQGGLEKKFSFFLKRKDDVLLSC